MALAMTRRPTPLQLCALAALLLVSSLTAAAETEWFNVELIVFTRTNPALDSEVWPENPGAPNTQDALTLPPAQAPATQGDPVPFEPLAPADYQLDDAWQHLENASHYRPVLHLGWRQPGLGAEAAKAVRVQWGMTTTPDAAGQTLDSPSAVTASGDTTDATVQGIDPAVDAPSGPTLDGTVEFTQSRYLHLAVDLVYRVPVASGYEGTDAPTNGTEGEATDGSGAVPMTWLQPYRLEESRRVAAGELHYFDHPVFGVIALVTPYKPPEPKDPEPASSAQPPTPDTASPATQPSPQAASPDGAQPAQTAPVDPRKGLIQRTQ